MADLEPRTSLSPAPKLTNAGKAWVRSVLGDRKTGKSYFARHNILANELGQNSLGIMWTPNGAASDPCDIKGMVDMTAEELINCPRCPAAVCLRDEDPELVCQLAVAAASKFRVTLLLDEAHQIFPENFSPKSKASELFHRGRHLGVNLIAVSQWPAHLSKKLFRASDTVYWFRLNAYEDLKWLERRYGENAAKEVNNLQRFHHIEIHGDDLPETWRKWQGEETESEDTSHIVQPESPADGAPDASAESEAPNDGAPEIPVGVGE